jgi:lipid-binding SYLF domain-containing protein
MDQTGGRRLAVTAVMMLVAMTIATQANAFGWPKKKSPDKQRAQIHQLEEEVLDRLFGEDPDTKDMIGKAAGYAVFSNTGMNLGVLSTANGKGLAHDNSGDKDIYMKMYSVGAGIGLGIKKFSAVFIFHSRDAFDQFVNEGWDFSGQADAAATTDSDDEEQVGAADESIALMKNVSVYQFTDKGLALQATLQGTKYWKNDKLN